MKPVFTKPTDADAVPQAHLDRLRLIYFEAVEKSSLVFITSCIDLFDGYRQLPFGMNSNAYREFKAKPNAVTDMPSLRRLTRILRERSKLHEEDADKLTLEGWQETLSTEQLEEISSPKKDRGDLMPQYVKLSMYFRENI